MRMRLWSWRQRPSASAMVTVVLPVPPLKLIAAMIHFGNSVLAIAQAPQVLALDGEGTLCHAAEDFRPARYFNAARHTAPPRGSPPSSLHWGSPAIVEGARAYGSTEHFP